MNVTRVPWAGPWQIRPVHASGLRTALQPDVSCDSRSANPSRSIRAAVSSCRVSTLPSSTSSTASPRASICGGVTPKVRCHTGFSQVRAAAISDR